MIFCMTRSVIFEIAVQSAVHSGRKFCRDYHWHNLGRGKVYFNKACLLECLGEADTVLIGILTHTFNLTHTKNSAHLSVAQTLEHHPFVFFFFCALQAHIAFKCVPTII